MFKEKNRAGAKVAKWHKNILHNAVEKLEFYLNKGKLCVRGTSTRLLEAMSSQ